MHRLMVGFSWTLAVLLFAFPHVGAQAQAFTVLHNFTGARDGSNPYAGLTVDANGNLYGTANQGGTFGAGTVFKLGQRGTGWTFAPLYSFSGSDGANPGARVVFGPDGTLYGTTTNGGQGFGVVYRLRPSSRPPATPLSNWDEQVLYSFPTFTDGAFPYSEPIFDPIGNMYLTTFSGGMLQTGTVVQLTHSGGGWTATILYNFSGGPDGGSPRSGVMLDSAGNLYGTTIGPSVVYQLVHSGSQWMENVLYTFQFGSDGYSPSAGLIFDTSGNLYGATNSGGPANGGTIFELAPSGNMLAYSLVYGLSGTGSGNGPVAALTMDAAGNLYGTTYGDGANGLGSVFKLSRLGDSWTYSTLHDFSGTDGKNPDGGVVLDANGNLYGTTSSGGANGLGVVWQIAP